MDKYLKTPGTLSLSKALHDIYKNLELDTYRDGDESQTGNNRSEMAGESESESVQMHIRDHIIRMDNQAFEFEPINATAVWPNNLGKHRAENFHGYVQIKLFEQTKRIGTI